MELIDCGTQKSKLSKEEKCYSAIEDAIRYVSDGVDAKGRDVLLPLHSLMIYVQNLKENWKRSLQNVR